MSKNAHLLIDCNNICHRSFHALSALRHEGMATGVVFGFLRSLLALQRRFPGAKPVFCWDGGRLKRKEIDPRYKSNRTKSLNGEHNELFEQMDTIRSRILPELGYRNILSKVGYEADDVIASLAEQRSRTYQQCFIVSSDNDLLQLLWQDHCAIWNVHSGKMVTARDFRKKWFKLSPRMWPDIKAIAGCKTDGIPGVPGVGEITAAKFLADKLGAETKAAAAINSLQGRRIWEENLRLVSLPLPGTGTFDLADDDFNHNAWREIVREYGLKSLEKHDAIVTGK